MTASGAAPFYDDVAGAPGGGQCRFLTAADGVRLRVAHWRPEGGAKGTVLLFPGRTEYIEKYGPAAAEMLARGYALATIDWRGQGLADRALPDASTGHVARFTDYQKDVAAFLAYARSAKLPAPFFLMAHSMGGQIGLRALFEGLPVRAAAFSAPMWGIRMHPGLRPVAWAASTIATLSGRGSAYAPGTRPLTYMLETTFDDNVLTRDAPMFAWLRRQAEAHPDLVLGGPSLQWLNEALRDCLALSRRASPDLPCFTMLGTRERVVDPARIHQRMARWPKGTLEMAEGAEHEVMMERAEVRARFFDQAAALFARAARG